MQNFKLPYFGKIEIDLEKEYNTFDTQIGNQGMSVDINFISQKVDEETLKIIRDFLLKMEQFNQTNIEEYKNDFNQGGETDDYLQFYIDELFQEELENIIDTKQGLQQQKQQLLNKLELIRVGLYPNNNQETDYFGVFDYSIKIDDEYCNQLLVVKTNNQGELDHITWES